jgi:hypothetical protein
LTVYALYCSSCPPIEYTVTVKQRAPQHQNAYLSKVHIFADFDSGCGGGGAGGSAGGGDGTGSLARPRTTDGSFEAVTAGVEKWAGVDPASFSTSVSTRISTSRRLSGFDDDSGSDDDDDSQDDTTGKLVPRFESTVFDYSMALTPEHHVLTIHLTPVDIRAEVTVVLKCESSPEGKQIICLA